MSLPTYVDGVCLLLTRLRSLSSACPRDGCKSIKDSGVSSVVVSVSVSGLHLDRHLQADSLGAVVAFCWLVSGSVPVDLPRYQST